MIKSKIVYVKDAILQPLYHTFTMLKTICSNDGGKIVVNIERDEIEYCLINVYSPTQDMENDQICFLQDLSATIEENLANKLLIGGDFIRRK